MRNHPDSPGVRAVNFSKSELRIKAIEYYQKRGWRLRKESESTLIFSKKNRMAWKKMVAKSLGVTLLLALISVILLTLTQATIFTVIIAVSPFAGILYAGLRIIEVKYGPPRVCKVSITDDWHVKSTDPGLLEYLLNAQKEDYNIKSI